VKRALNIIAVAAQLLMILAFADANEASNTESEAHRLTVRSDAKFELVARINI